MSEGMADIPEESNVDTESDGARLGEYEDFSDGDRDKYYDDTQAPKKSESEQEQDDEDLEDDLELFETARKRKKKVTGTS